MIVRWFVTVLATAGILALALTSVSWLSLGGPGLAAGASADQPKPQAWLPVAGPAVVAPAATLAPTPAGTAATSPVGPPAADCAVPTAGTGWLSYLNEYRAGAGLPAVAENRAWSCGVAEHARYIVKTDQIAHDEERSNPWYTAEGLVAGQSSNVAGSYRFDRDDRYAIDAWLQAPFHAVGMLDPQLLASAYGSFQESGSGVQWAAVLDVLRGESQVAVPARYPIEWPGENTTIALSRYWGESPDPLASCPSYTAPAGLPIILQLGDGGETPVVTATSLVQAGVRLDHCAFDETSYTNPDPASERAGRAILDSRDAIVLIPRRPLMPGQRYTVSITSNGTAYTWSFDIATAVRDTGS